MKLKSNNSIKISNNILKVGLLVSLFLNMMSIYRIHFLENQMDFNYRWMIIKKIRAELIEKRLDELEKNIKVKPDKNGISKERFSLELLGLYEEINELGIKSKNKKP